MGEEDQGDRNDSRCGSRYEKERTGKKRRRVRTGRALQGEIKKKVNRFEEIPRERESSKGEMKGSEEEGLRIVVCVVFPSSACEVHFGDVGKSVVALRKRGEVPARGSEFPGFNFRDGVFFLFLSFVHFLLFFPFYFSSLFQGTLYSFVHPGHS